MRGLTAWERIVLGYALDPNSLPSHRTPNMKEIHASKTLMRDGRLAFDADGNGIVTEIGHMALRLDSAERLMGKK